MNVKELHQYRKEIDKLINASILNIIESKEHTPQTVSDKLYREQMAIVSHKLTEAKMWAGKCLGTLGEELPEQYADNDDSAPEEKE